METLSHQKEVKANKDHRCDFCGEKIIQGEKYNTSTHKNDGVVYTWKTHTHCSEMANRLKMYEDCDEGLTGDSFQEIIHDVHDNLLISKIPKDDVKNYSDIIQQIRHVQFRYKLSYVIRHYVNLDKSQHPTQG